MPRAKLRRSRKRAVCGFALGSTSGYGLRCSGAAPRPFIGFGSDAEDSAPASSVPGKATRPIDVRERFAFQRRPQQSAAAQGGLDFSIVFDAPPETAAYATGFVSFGNSAARADPRRAGPGGEVLRDQPAVIPIGIDGEFHDAAPHGRHGAGASRENCWIEETTSSAWPGAGGSSSDRWLKPGARSASPSGV